MSKRLNLPKSPRSTAWPLFFALIFSLPFIALSDRTSDKLTDSVQAIWATPIDNANHFLLLKSGQGACVWTTDDVTSMRILDVTGSSTFLKLPAPEESCEIEEVVEAPTGMLWVATFECASSTLTFWLVDSSGNVVRSTQTKASDKHLYDRLYMRPLNDGSLLATWPEAGNKDKYGNVLSDTLVLIPPGDNRERIYRLTGDFDAYHYVSLDERHFLLWANDGQELWLFDSSLQEVPKRILRCKPKGTSGPRSVVVLPNGGPIVVLGSDDRVYRFDRTGKALDNGNSAIANETFGELEAAGDGRRVWLRTSSKDRVYLLDASGQSMDMREFTSEGGTGKVEQSFLPIPDARLCWFFVLGQYGARIWDVDGSKWLSDKSILTDWAFSSQIHILPSGRLLLTGYGPALCLIDADGNPEKQAIVDGYSDVDRSQHYPYTSESKVPNSLSHRFVIPVTQKDGSCLLIDDLGTRLGTMNLGLQYRDFPEISDVYPLEDLKGFWLRTWHKLYFVRPDSGSLKADTAMVHQGNREFLIYPSKDNRSLWILADGRAHFVQLSADNLQIRASSIDEHQRFKGWDLFHPLGLGARAIAVHEDTSKCFFIGSDINIDRLRISLGGLLPSVFDLGAQRGLQTKKGISIEMDGVLPFKSKDARAMCHVEFRTATGETIKTGKEEVRSMELPIHFDWPSKLNIPCSASVSLAYTDRFGTQVKAITPVIQLLPATDFWTAARRNALGAWMGTLLLIILSQHRIFPNVARRFIPAILIACGGAFFVPAVNSRFEIDRVLLCVLFGGTFVLFVFAGIIRPTLLRRLAQVFPSDEVVPILLRFPLVRRAFFREYIDHLEEVIREQRRDAREDGYLPVPAAIEWPHNAVLDVRSDEVLASVLLGSGEHVPAVAGLAKQSVGTDILISSPGGQGKTALLRRLVEITIREFRATGRTAIPLYCKGIDGRLVLSAKQALGAKYVIERAFEDQLQLGFFLIVIDGISEEAPSADTIEVFLRRGTKTRLLLSSRPDSRYERALLASSNALIVQPMRLDDNTIQPFEEIYLGNGKQLSDHVRAVCAGPDGTYLPILVRLAATALKAGKDNPKTVADIFEAAFDTLLKVEGELERAAALCIDTYWTTGSRTIPARIAKHQSILDQLIKAGVLVANERSTNVASHKPQELRFFHDSMQTFLTAVGLFNLPGESRWQCLTEAAGDERFTRNGSELFEMCIQVFRPKKLLRRKIHDELLGWGKCHYHLFSVAQITKGADFCDFSPSSDLTIKAVVEAVIQACDVQDIDAAIRNLASVFANLAPVVWGAGLADRRI